MTFRAFRLPRVRSALQFANMLRCAVLASCSALLITTPSAAQICSGEPTFTEGSTRGFGSIAFRQGLTYRLGVVVGGRRVFGWGGAGLAATGGDLSSEYRLGAGIQLSRRPERRLHVCPEVLLQRTAVSDAGLTTLDLTHLTASIGVDVGYVVLRKGFTRIVPTTNVQFVTGQLRTHYVNGVRRTNGIRSYVLLDAGVGLCYDEEFTASPSIVLPLGQGAEIAYVIGFSVRF